LSIDFVTTEEVGSHYGGHKYVIDELKNVHVFPQKFSSFALLVKNLLHRQSKDSLFIMGRYLCKYIYNVPHNFLNCLMIGAANNETIRLQVKF